MDQIIKLPKKLIDFVKESYAELKKVTWLSRQDTIRATIGVFIVIIFFAIYVGLVDFLIGRLILLLIK